MSRIVIILALVLFYSGGVCYAEDQPLERGLVGKRTELTHLKKELQRKKQKVKAIGKKEHSVGSELIRIERRLSKRTRELKLLRSKIRKLNNKMKVVDNQVSKIDEDIRALRSRLDVCLTAMYKFGGIGHIQAVFSSRSYIDMSRPYRFINIILNDDLELIEQYKEELLMIGEKKEKLERAERKLVTLKADRELRKSQIQARIESNNSILTSIKREKMLYVAKVKELERSSERLQSMIEQLDREKSGGIGEDGSGYLTHGIAKLKGKLSIPVSGQILPLFGKQKDPGLNTFTFHKGIDIIAPVGSKIKAVYDGKVVFSEWFKGYGKIIIIDHGQSYYTLFAHASKLLKEAGDQVTKGEVIALVGDTDSLKGPHLYFEIRHHEKPQNPMHWLAIPRGK